MKPLELLSPLHIITRRSANTVVTKLLWATTVCIGLAVLYFLGGLELFGVHIAVVSITTLVVLVLWRASQST